MGIDPGFKHGETAGAYFVPLRYGIHSPFATIGYTLACHGACNSLFAGLGHSHSLALSSLCYSPIALQGIKVAVVDSNGSLLDTATFFPHPPQRDWSNSVDACGRLLEQYQCTLIALGNGTACRETEKFCSVLREKQPDLRYAIINECGTSIYSVSPAAEKELGSISPNLRSAVAIARRLQDPLAELVKVEPQHLGVGM